ncbi:hypothetical protein P7K49_018560 [Saguinus oedipus]|uniref:T-cell leukemia/lymphoma protein 1A n=1 Tax=Saguinus oedipus TaxID=9490 RepID=A0ABQ9V5P6_SAGOE|nr:hypothetical protein P7K49_018560 [Saguinus oedipus]
MAQEQLRRESVTDHPDRLWIWEKFVYLDENQRTWLPLVIKVQPDLERMECRPKDGNCESDYNADYSRTFLGFRVLILKMGISKKEDKLQVFLRQEVTILGKPMTPTQIGPSLLPLMWQLYPDGRYRSSDSGYWRIVYHVKASVFLPGIYGLGEGTGVRNGGREGLQLISALSISASQIEGLEDMLLEQLPDD